VGVATLGDVAPPRRWPTGILRGHQAAEATERGRPTEPAPVADLAGQGQGSQPGHAPVGGQAVHGIGERRLVIPAGQVGLDGGQAASRASSVAR
jgi:hypothetical protein